MAIPSTCCCCVVLLTTATAAIMVVYTAVTAAVMVCLAAAVSVVAAAAAVCVAMMLLVTMAVRMPGNPVLRVLRAGVRNHLRRVRRAVVDVRRARLPRVAIFELGWL